MRSVLAAVAFVALWSNAGQAQDFSEKPEGIVCLQPECDIRKSLPLGNIEYPSEAAPYLIHRLRNTSASLLDPGLPEMPFADWLFRSLYFDISRSDESFANWSLTACDNRASAFPQPSLDLCIEVSVPVHLARTVSAVIIVAEGRRGTGWHEVAPRVHDVYIARLDQNATAIDSLDVGRLLNVAPALAVPFDIWPAVDLKTAITWTPQTPKPDDTVVFTFSVANVGKRDLERAEVNILIAVSLNDTDLKEIRRVWFPRVPAGKTVRLDISARLVRGDAMISINAIPHSSKRLREENADDNNTAAVILPIR